MPQEKKSCKALSKWIAVPLPIIAGLLHLRVFASCVSNACLAYTGMSSISTQEFQKGSFALDQAVFIAYFFDIICCFVGVIPFSRCRSSGDIIGHHFPTLFLALPLGLCVVSEGMAHLEPTVFSILTLEKESVERSNLIFGYLITNALAYSSSLNEVFMCFQRAEMSLQSKTQFKEILQMKNRVFTSRFAISIELCCKLAIFWGISILACMGCCLCDKALYDLLVVDKKLPLIMVLRNVYSSPLVLKGVLYRLFSILMYPKMGTRALKKIKEFIREGNTPRKVY